MRVELRTGPLDVAEVLAWVARPGAGAVDLFCGAVRDATKGHPVTALEYQAYGPLALREMERIAAEIEARHPDTRCAVVHRTGLLSVGELAVICAVSAPHRAEAFAACRALIDRIKETVPIWKRELGPDGGRWVEGCADHAR